MAEMGMLSRRSLLIFLANAVGALLGYVGIFAVARFMPQPAEALGLLGFGMGLVGTFFVLTDLGVRAAHVKRISEGVPVDEALGTFLLLKVVQVSLAVGVTFLALWVWTDVLGRGFETPEHLRVVFVMILYYLAISAADLGITTFDAQLETARAQAAHLGGTATRTVGMVIVAFGGLSPLALAWAWVVGAFAVAVIALAFLRGERLTRPSWGRVRSYTRFALPLSIPAVLVALTASVDKALIQLFWGAVQVGYYFAAQRLFLLLVGVATAVSLLLFPTLSQYHARNQLEMLRVKSREAERYLSMLLAPVAAFLFLYPEGVIHVLLSDSFLPAADILRLFALAAFIFGLSVTRGAILQGMNRPDLAGLVLLASGLVILAGYALLIPTSLFGVPLGGLGPEGAALSVLGGFAVAFTLGAAFSYRLMGDRPQKSVTTHIAAAVATALLFAVILPPILGLGWQWFHLLAASVSFLGAYLGILTALREFRRADLRLVLDLLDPRKMARYVYGELRGNKRG